ncbi:MAG: Acetylornithine aminotransferase (EC [uncultured Thiotrichaceae bacterium]|uniref:Acetylornithine aminotransferase n=1 Tax=uncultured Thiotrichaceae bacterium TaxID=298394 RepID=A0A6S6TGF2_9GAMM|nr:MAG: Acetylornithine aminotransferase (EC [uncultured Thiotrichaceae bacterium]
MSDAIMATYSRLPVTFTKGADARLWDTEDREYVDALSGIAVCSLGHAHPEIAKAISDQAHTLIHTSNLYGIEPQEKLASKLAQLSGMEQVFFSNSGTEANEAAIKLARRYGSGKGVSLPKIIVVEGSFHGRTMAALSATGNKKIQEGFAPLLEGFVHVPYNDLSAIEVAMDDQVVAIMVEPIQGEGGINIPDEGYLKSIRQLCNKHGCLMILDEIQAGMCRTGTWFGYQHEDVTPDVVTLAKALGNGVPIGAMLARGEAVGVLVAGTHGSTFGGNFLACRTALTVVEVMERDAMAARAKELGEYFLKGFASLAELSGVKDVRGKGLMLGIELEKDCPELVLQALEAGLLINVTAGSVIRLLPPIVMTNEQADSVIETVSRLVKEFIA